MRKGILCVAIVSLCFVAVARSEQVALTVQLSIPTEFVSVDPLQFDSSTSNWTVSAWLKIPDGYCYTNLPVDCRVDRMRVAVGPVAIPDVQMAAMFGTAYPGLRAAVEMGTLAPGPELSAVLVQALADAIEGNQ